MRALTMLVLVVASAQAQTAVLKAPEQPLPFSHKAHADANLECKACHPGPKPGKIAGIATASECMSCHKTVMPESPEIQKLAAYAKSKREIPWVRIYQIPAFVKFSHRSHADSGVTCEDCHGPVETRVKLFRERIVKQEGCLECHNERNAGTACTFCHA